MPARVAPFAFQGIVGCNDVIPEGMSVGLCQPDVPARKRATRGSTEQCPGPRSTVLGQRNELNRRPKPHGTRTLPNTAFGVRCAPVWDQNGRLRWAVSDPTHHQNRRQVCPCPALCVPTYTQTPYVIFVYLAKLILPIMSISLC